MRDLDEALARLARRDKLHNRHTKGGYERPGEAVHEVTEALRQLVERHRGLSVVARIEDGDASTEIRAVREGDRVEVTTREILSGAVLPPPPRNDSTVGSLPLDDYPLDGTVFDVPTDQPGLGSVLQQFGLGRTTPLVPSPDAQSAAEPSAQWTEPGGTLVAEEPLRTEPATPAGPPEWPPRR